MEAQKRQWVEGQKLGMEVPDLSVFLGVVVQPQGSRAHDAVGRQTGRGRDGAGAPVWWFEPGSLPAPLKEPGSRFPIFGIQVSPSFPV